MLPYWKWVHTSRDRSRAASSVLDHQWLLAQGWGAMLKVPRAPWTSLPVTRSSGGITYVGYSAGLCYCFSSSSLYEAFFIPFSHSGVPARLPAWPQCRMSIPGLPEQPLLATGSFSMPLVRRPLGRERW